MRRFFLVAIAFLIFLQSHKISFAQGQLIPTTTPFPTPTPVEYQLPYPGLLPDHPLYFVKAIRDKIMDILISDPLKKAEFNLLSADKRLNSGIFLFNNGKQQLAAETISKGENYFEKAIESVKEAKKQGKDANYIIARLLLSAKKHQDVTKDLENKASKNIKSSLNSSFQRASDLEKKVNEINL
ncbi:MAG: DUF5667 domain-containing protein [Patescibacteria group bacterium]|nr:DUF5667 domain-containing protein [Patescibacteria group bacterium]